MVDYPGILTLPTYFYVDNQDFYQEERALMPLPRGTGIIWGDGTRYRVVDTWFSYDHHGQMAEGLHVFLEKVIPGSADDRPKAMLPAYFTDEREPVFDRFVDPSA